MNKLSFLALAALLTAGRQTMGAQQGVAPSDKLLARAHHKATVDGDLKGAIEDYKKLAQGPDRMLAARALPSGARLRSRTNAGSTSQSSTPGRW